jgi:hypothetical protein
MKDRGRLARDAVGTAGERLTPISAGGHSFPRTAHK